MIVLLQKNKTKKWNWLKLNELKFQTARKNKPLSLPLKKTVVKIWNEKWFEKKKSSFNNPALFWYHKKMNNNEKKLNSNQVWSHILKKNKFMYSWKVHIPFLSTTLQNTAQSRAKKCLFCIQNKKVVKQLLAKMILKKSHFGFPPISILTYPFYPPI